MQKKIKILLTFDAKTMSFEEQISKVSDNAFISWKKKKKQHYVTALGDISIRKQ